MNQPTDSESQLRSALRPLTDRPIWIRVCGYLGCFYAFFYLAVGILLVNGFLGDFSVSNTLTYFVAAVIAGCLGYLLIRADHALVRFNRDTDDETRLEALHSTMWYLAESFQVVALLLLMGLILAVPSSLFIIVNFF